ncbi:TPA: transcriptional antiterminator, partial [Clostridioides difficile]
MIFLIDKSVENFAYFSQLTPYTAKYPNVKERTTKEMIELVLTFLQEEAVNLNCRIKVTGNAIASFLSADYTYNLFQLRNEIVYSLSNNLYSSVITNHEPIVITHENISKN